MTSSSFNQKLPRSLLSICLIILLLYLGRHILTPLAFGALFALLFTGPCRFIEKGGVPRGLSSLFCVIGLVFTGLVIGYFVSSQLISLRNDLAVLVNQLTNGVNELEGYLQQKFEISNDSMQAFLHSFTSQVLSETHLLVSSTVNLVSGTVIFLVLIPVYCFLLLYYRHLIAGFFVRSFAEENTQKVLDVLHKAQYVTRRYITGLFIEMMIVAILNCLGFLILGVRYALLLGTIAALFNLIPYLGIFMALILSLLITFSTNSPATAFGVAIVLVAVHLTDANIIMPRIVGSRVRINALVTILGVITGSALWGIPGMFLAIPFLAILKVVFDEVDELSAWGFLLGEDPAGRHGGRRKRWARLFLPRKGKK